jgi:undecaprenyl-diphosphatase
MANPFLDWLMPRITNLHHIKWFMALVILGCLIALWKGSRQIQLAVLCAIIAVSASDLLASRVIKRLIVRERPCLQTAAGHMEFADTRLAPGEHCPGSRAFPSNHASNMMALAGVGCWFGRRKSRWLWFLLPLIIGYSRVYLGYHYPSDVMGGWLIGGIIAAVVIIVVRRLFGHTVRAIEPDGQSDPA